MRLRRLAPRRHRWLRVCRPEWSDPFDTSWAEVHGGRWNPPGSWPTLYLNRDLRTARAQIARLLEGTPVTPDDLADDAYEVAAALLPARPQTVVDIVTDDGVAAAGLPASYPVDERGDRVGHEACWPIATAAHDQRCDGIECRSAATADGSGRELAWWPRGRRVVVVGARLPYGAWRRDDPDLG